MINNTRLNKIDELEKEIQSLKNEVNDLKNDKD